MLKVDVFLMQARPFDREAFQRVRQSQVSETEPERLSFFFLLLLADTVIP